MPNKPGRPLAPWGKTKAVQIPAQLIARVLDMVQAFKQGYAKPQQDDETVI